ncbi:MULTISPECIES: LysR family transcriptional regulator [Rhizobium]|jgi:DNA-binding transcriptional LysR family regulator|uniref:HTH-type transcriptional regulator TtuA n=1 Tax=Rhizobium lusitanum TaxID=293958 RepID=A0A1C3UGA7_9HYPH|nr:MULTISPECIES: LysR family transcriptional regulator [Rhizobium]NKJ36046.1 DNA-binding transcriptional LysR family regulator [Rhizobium sp. SG570]NTJ08717.1 LysR family transcriptional regulator [Rhizobium lusitanum]SCB14523.1 DNA-binding transcriptional regulator, LysR family [Rhizobium lusitanum]
MLRENVNDLLAFLVVARERSFTKAAAKLGISQSGLSHTIRGLEERLGLRLLTRTTRSVAPTPEGERLLTTIGPRFEEIEGELIALTDLREKPAGTIRITAEDFAIDHVLWPKLRKVLHNYPDIKVEFVIDYGLTDIVAERFDAGVRLGEIVSQAMIAVRISPEQRMIVIGSPDYLERNPAPVTPQELPRHNCINLRLPTRGGLYAWEFEKDGEELRVRVDGQLTCNGITQILTMAVDGYGLGFVPEGLAKPEIDAGRVVQVLGDWCPYYPGYHLYYPSRRQSSAAFNVVVDALRDRG